MAGGARIHGYGQRMVWKGWGGWCRGRGLGCFLIEVLLHVGGDVLDGKHGLLACGFDLGLGQQEAVTTSVTQLEGVGIFHPQVVGPVIRASCSRV